MFDISGPLMDALNASRDGLASAASATARSQTPLGGSRTDAAMADSAEKAIFQEALLNAVHARLEEVKSVTHS